MTGFRLKGALIGLVVSAGIGCILGLYQIWKVFPPLFSVLRPEFEWQRLIKFSLTLFLAGFGFFITRRTDILMLGYFTDSATVGIYTSAISISILISFPQQALTQILGPLVSDLYSNGNMSNISKLFKMTSRWVYILAIYLCLIMVFFSSNILAFLFGKSFKSGWSILVLFITFEFLNISVGQTGYTLQMTGNERYYLVINGSSAILNIGLNILLIPVYGAMGAAIATGISLVLNNYTELAIIYKKFGIHPWSNSYYRIFAPLVLTALVLVLLKFTGLHWMIDIIIATGIYFFSLYELGLTSEDKMILFSLWGEHEKNT